MRTTLIDVNLCDNSRHNGAMGQLQYFTNKDYLLFLLFYASHVDYKFSELERAYLKKQYPRLYFTLAEDFTKMDEGERIYKLTEGIINDIRTDGDKQILKEALMKQFWIDGKFCDFERSFYQYFDRLINAV